MPTPDLNHLTEQQKKWFASIRDSMERETGKPLAAWVEIARSCPETTHRARLGWFKTHHGLMQNRASLVLGEAFPTGAHWNQPETLLNALWTDPASRLVYDAVSAAVQTFPDVVIGQRKGYSAWSRRYQFAALRPIKGGAAMLGLALAPEADDRLEAPKNEGWSERLKARLSLASAQSLSLEVVALLKAAWSAS